MAIMQSCCCFSNVRSGSQACGVYSLISSMIYLAITSYNLAVSVTTLNESPVQASGITTSEIDGIYAAYGIDIIVLSFLLIASIVLLVGILYDNKAMLIPYMVAITALMTVQVIAWIILFVLLGLGSFLLIFQLVIWLLFTALNITCLLCVISQYQELREGNGRAAFA